jgi:hypothetical protein
MTTMIPVALELNRQTCRDYVASKFSVNQMVDGYEAVYHQIFASRISLNGHHKAHKISVY